MKLKNVKFGTKCILKTSNYKEYRFNAGDVVLIHVTKLTPAGSIGVIKIGGNGHEFRAVLDDAHIPPIPDGCTGLWVKIEELKRVKDSK